MAGLSQLSYLQEQERILLDLYLIQIIRKHDKYNKY